jgi:hypothetical protein
MEYIESVMDHSILWENHCHAKYEMIAVEEGDITVLLEGQKYRLKKNQIIIIPPLFYHSVTANGEGSYRRITALFGPDAIPRVLQDELTGQGRNIAIDASRMEKIKEICQKKDSVFYAPLLQSLMIEIFYDALQIPQATTKIETDEFLQKTFQYSVVILYKLVSWREEWPHNKTPCAVCTTQGALNILKLPGFTLLQVRCSRLHPR